MKAGLEYAVLTGHDVAKVPGRLNDKPGDDAVPIETLAPPDNEMVWETIDVTVVVTEPPVNATGASGA